MRVFVSATILSFILWLLLTFNGSLWQADEILAGIVFSILAGLITAKINIKEHKNLS